MANRAQWQNSRGVIERIFIKGTLVLQTPAGVGNGDAEGTTDIPLLFDPLDEKTPLLTGASIAGALRNALREREMGYGYEEQPQSKQKSLAEQLFGHLDESTTGENGLRQRSAVESWLMVDDALGALPEGHLSTELRDGVAIDPVTRTVEEDEPGRDGHKYDMELLPAGTTFPLSFEFWKSEQNDELLAALAAALKDLEDGEIGIGLRKRRGFGQCQVTGWQVWRYRMDSPEGLLGWLRHDGVAGGENGAHIEQLLNVSLPEDRRETFILDADFALIGSILIRSDGFEEDGADMVHLKSYRKNGMQPVLSGTSLAGVLRGRALRIAKTMLGPEQGTLFINELFGRRIHLGDKDATGSLVTIRETVISGGIDGLTQNRVKIDRFTGGSYPQALFSQQPLWSNKSDRQIHVHLALRRLQEQNNGSTGEQTRADFLARIGLLLLTLKDLWTGDLPVGGESSVGRGRLQGLEATLTLRTRTAENRALSLQTWHIRQQDTDLDVDGEGDMQELVDAFLAWRAPVIGERERQR